MSMARDIIVRRIILGVAFPLTMAAAPPPGDVWKQPLMAEATIGTETRLAPSNAPVGGYTPAPMPDLDRDAPVAQVEDPNAPRVSPRLFHKQTTYHGEGYVFGSTVQDEHDRHVGPTPGINLIMPLQ